MFTAKGAIVLTDGWRERLIVDGVEVPWELTEVETREWPAFSTVTMTFIVDKVRDERTDPDV